MSGEFNDLGQPSPKPLADQLVNGKRMVSRNGDVCSSNASTMGRSSVT